MATLFLPLSASMAVAATHSIHRRSHQSADAAASLTAFPPAMVKLMDASVDPCEDFYKHACGGWYNETTIAPSAVHASIMMDLDSQVNAVLSSILQANKPNLGKFYNACVDMNARNEFGVAPLTPDLDAIFNASSTESVLRVAASLALKKVPGFVQINVAGHPETDATHNKLFLAPTLRLLDATYYSTSGNSAPFESAYRKYVSLLFQLAGFENNEAMVNAVMDWELAVQHLENADVTNDAPTMSQAAHKYPLGVGVLLKVLNVDDDPSKSVVLQPQFPDLETLLLHTTTEDLKAILAFKLLHFHALDLSQPFTDAHTAFDKMALHEGPNPLTNECRAAVLTKIPSLVGKYYVDEVWTTKTAGQATAMVEALKTAFNSGLESLDWLDKTTLANAKVKMAKLVYTLGGPRDPQVYSSIQFDSKTYVANMDRAATIDMRKKLASVNQPADRFSWFDPAFKMDMTSYTVNAGFGPETNAIVVAAAILQFPLFQAENDPAQNFGASGVVVGHEIVHGFDNSGRTFDGDGNKRVWWTNETSAKFNEKATCIAKQYGSLDVVSETTGETLSKLNGTLTLGETIADNGGLKSAFRAYQAYMKTVVKPAYTQENGEKLFFLAFGQTWCEKNSDASLKHRLSRVHPPGKYRVWGAVRNNDEFARVFNCPKDSRMNPSTKCHLWE
ncbi:Aste57867_22824 [Aphanomyces stellatus]|uniref:Aste57867_22824 protein n=1 Tax=Aphanomyces stellatus TaxID=120398 RepID=A0A485LLL9_9STRA|nr:hypothetical protein As57867_022754 [Aphanomyces stellatus]VFT99475.1 Aste57867_22824 [Aphanomyces stellatus]